MNKISFGGRIQAEFLPCGSERDGANVKIFPAPKVLKQGPSFTGIKLTQTALKTNEKGRRENSEKFWFYLLPCKNYPWDDRMKTFVQNCSSAGTSKFVLETGSAGQMHTNTFNLQGALSHKQRSCCIRSTPCANFEVIRISVNLF